jgi:hypothetical protein
MYNTTGDKLTNKEFFGLGFAYYSDDYKTEIVIEKCDQGFAAFASVDNEVIPYKARCTVYATLKELIFAYYVVYGYMVNYCSDAEALVILDSLKEERKAQQ